MPLVKWHCRVSQGASGDLPLDFLLMGTSGNIGMDVVAPRVARVLVGVLVIVQQHSLVFVAGLSAHVRWILRFIYYFQPVA